MCLPVSVYALVCSCVYNKATLLIYGSITVQSHTTTCSAIIRFLYAHPEYLSFNIQVNTNIHSYFLTFPPNNGILYTLLVSVACHAFTISFISPKSLN